MENDASMNPSIVACVFAATIKFLPIRCVASVAGSHTDTDRWEGFIMYAVEMGSGAMIYIPSFVNIGSGFQKLI
jgi:hypothetical protein